jgi:alpha-1,2-mannosyltransferase
MREKRVLVRGGATALRCVIVVVTAGFGWLVASWLGERVNGVDLRVYYGAVRWWLSGHDLYAYPHQYTYPPFAAVCMLPMTLLTEQQALVATRVAILVTVAVTTGWLVVPVARRHGWSAWPASPPGRPCGGGTGRTCCGRPTGSVRWDRAATSRWRGC